MLKIPLIDLHFVNDVQQIGEAKILQKIQVNTHFSFSFIALLIGSSIVCTLGLLLNAPPVIIGGMIISPLMWPLVKISLGVSYGRAWYIRQAITLLFFSIVITFISSSLITFISPIKLINGEILARANPTLLDIVVALVAGAIAALAITQPRISESLAGVAIATALMPPLCVSGIAAALSNYPIFIGSFLLFNANIISIIFISVLVFLFVGVKSKADSTLRKRGVIFIGVILFITAIPLFFFLKNYSFQTFAYSKVQEILRKSFKEISPSIYIESVKTDVSPKGSSNILIEAQVYLPEDLTIDYQQQQKIIDSLEKALGRKVDLNLRLQRTISIISQKDRIHEISKKILQETFLSEIQKINSSFSVDSLEITIDEKGQIFNLNAVLRSDPSLSMTQEQCDSLEKILSKKIGKKVSLDIEIVSRIQLQSDPEIENQKIKQEVQKLVRTVSDQIDISSVSLKKESVGLAEEESKITIIDLELKVPKEFEIENEAFDFIKEQLSQQFNKEFLIYVKLIEKKTYLF